MNCQFNALCYHFHEGSNYLRFTVLIFEWILSRFQGYQAISLKTLFLNFCTSLTRCFWHIFFLEAFCKGVFLLLNHFDLLSAALVLSILGSTEVISSHMFSDYLDHTDYYLPLATLFVNVVVSVLVSLNLIYKFIL